MVSDFEQQSDWSPHINHSLKVPVFYWPAEPGDPPESPLSIRGVLYVPHGTPEPVVEEHRHWGVRGIVRMEAGDTIWGPGGVMERLYDTLPRREPPPFN